MSREQIFALTSLSPLPACAAEARDCIQSWCNAGLRVRAFNHPSEIDTLKDLYDVEFVPVMETTASVFGRHYTPVKAMLDWAAELDAPVLLINSDINLRMADWELKRLRWLSDGGLCYFVRHNHDGDIGRAVRERDGLDAFLFHGRDVAQCPDSFLSMGQPFWDYWLPWLFYSRRRPIYAAEFPVAFHLRHSPGWSWQTWHRCGLEFNRLTNELGSGTSFEHCLANAGGVRHKIDLQKTSMLHRPPPIRAWVERTFSYQGPKTFLELGAHTGTDTAWIVQIPGVTLHAFEPDPRNHPPPRHNLTIHRAAVADRDGTGSLILSKQGWGGEWTYSSSIKRPKNHLQRYPVTFGEAVPIALVTLDTFHDREGLDVIDFIWADIQGAEGEMIRGGQQTLSRTRYLYTEYSDDELYEDQATLRDILDMLPDFRVLELWPEDVLLENRKLGL